MQIISRLCVSADGYITTPDGIPPQVLDPSHGPGSHGIDEFLESCKAALMGRTTFAPAIGNAWWPWPNLEVFVLGGQRPEGTPDHVVFDNDPERLLEKLRASNKGGDVHLIGGPTTIETFRNLGVLDRLELVMLPFFVGGGMRLTDTLNPETGLTFERSRPLPGGSVEIVYSVHKPGQGVVKKTLPARADS
jgi:dihydrofolate reductase